MLRKVLTIACAAAMCAGPCPAQKKLERVFVAGDVARYRVQLTARIEFEGQQLVEGGEKTYAQPFSHTIEIALSWNVTRRVTSVNPGGADIEETLDEFSDIAFSSPSALDMEYREMRDALRDSIQRWRGAESHVLNYRETPLGQLIGLRSEQSPAIDDWPPLLTPWLLRALRPTATLPDRDFRPSERWEEPRDVAIEGWSRVTGTESGEWLAGPTPLRNEPPSVRLHVVQQISANIPRGSSGGAGEGRFHGESLSTVAQGASPDGRIKPGHLMAATRSASREIVRVLDAVPGLPEQPRFRTRTSVQVEITPLPLQ